MSEHVRRSRLSFCKICHITLRKLQLSTFRAVRHGHALRSDSLHSGVEQFFKVSNVSYMLQPLRRNKLPTTRQIASMLACNNSR